MVVVKKNLPSQESQNLVLNGDHRSSIFSSCNETICNRLQNRFIVFFLKFRVSHKIGDSKNTKCIPCVAGGLQLPEYSFTYLIQIKLDLLKKRETILSCLYFENCNIFHKKIKKLVGPLHYRNISDILRI